MAARSTATAIKIRVLIEVMGMAAAVAGGGGGREAQRPRGHGGRHGTAVRRVSACDKGHGAATSALAGRRPCADPRTHATSSRHHRSPRAGRWHGRRWQGRWQGHAPDTGASQDVSSVRPWYARSTTCSQKRRTLKPPASPAIPSRMAASRSAATVDQGRDRSAVAAASRLRSRPYCRALGAAVTDAATVSPATSQSS